MALWCGLAAATVQACGNDGGRPRTTSPQSTSGASGDGGTGGIGGGGPNVSGSGGSGTGGVGSGGPNVSGSGGSGAGGTATACVPPDMLIVLDRTLTMHRTPDGDKPADAPNYGSSKWHQAITALEQVIAPPLDEGIRFGLELWPRDSGGCVRLEQQVTGSQSASNNSCETGEVLVEPALHTGRAIASALDPATTTLCYSTPTGQALLEGEAYLQANHAEDRDQYVMLVTDGADWADTCPSPDPLQAVQQLAAAGIKTYLVGFFSSTGSEVGTGVEFLNDMACAGHTAEGFPATCTQDGNGNYVAADPDNGAVLYHQASSTMGLATALDDIAAEVCCFCDPE